MKAKDTIMNDEQILAEVNFNAEQNPMLLDWLRKIAKAQAKIAFPLGKQQGIKEAADFIGAGPFEHNYAMIPQGGKPVYTHLTDDCFACKWQAFLKERGVEK